MLQRQGRLYALLQARSAVAISLLALCLSMAVPLAAQVAGAIEGTVVDSNGGIVRGAAVRVIETDTGAEKELATDGTGRFTVPSLLPGPYRVEVTQPGFRPETHTGIQVSSGRTSREDFRLQVGEITERIEVVAESPLLSTSATNWGGSVEKVQLDHLPLKGRDIFDLAVQQPGAQLASTAARAIYEGLSLPIAVDGIRPSMNSFRLDGISMNDATGSAPASAAAACWAWRPSRS